MFMAAFGMDILVPKGAFQQPIKNIGPKKWRATRSEMPKQLGRCASLDGVVTSFGSANLQEILTKQLSASEKQIGATPNPMDKALGKPKPRIFWSIRKRFVDFLKIGG